MHEGIGSIVIFFLRGCDVGVVEWGCYYGVEGLLTALVFPG